MQIAGNETLGPSTIVPGARAALWLLLGINLFNYIDRQILSAVLPKLALDATIFEPADPNVQFKLGLLTTAFMVSYMLLSPLFGYLGDRYSRWRLVGVGVILWSLATGGSGLAVSFMMLLAMRSLVGIGEAAYGPVAPSMLSDMYPVRDRGKILARFYIAIPVGSALGFVIGGAVAATSLGWRGAFLVAVVPGIVLGVICLFMREVPRPDAGSTSPHHEGYTAVFFRIWKVKSFRCNTIAMTASTFILGGVAAFAPQYIFEREARFQVSGESLLNVEQLLASDQSRVVPEAIIDKLRPLTAEKIYPVDEFKKLLRQTLTPAEYAQYSERLFDMLTAPDSITLATINLTFGVIVVLSGLFATLLGGMLGDALRERYRGAYFLVAGWGCIVAFPFFLGMLFLPFPYAWLCMFVAVFGLFFNTGPANTILANVVPSSVRATAFAINILIIHALGDAISPPIIGLIADYSNLQTAFIITSFFILIAGLVWRFGARYLEADTAAVTMPPLPLQ